MISNGRTAPQPRAFTTMPVWTIQSSRERPKLSRAIGPTIEPPATGESSRRLEDGPADLRAVPLFVRSLEGADDVLLADRSLHADRPLGDDSAQRRIGAVDVLDGAGVDGDRILDAGQAQQLDPAGRLGGGLDRDDGHDLAELVLEQLARIER